MKRASNFLANYISKFSDLEILTIDSYVFILVRLFRAIEEWKNKTYIKVLKANDVFDIQKYHDYPIVFGNSEKMLRPISKEQKIWNVATLVNYLYITDNLYGDEQNIFKYLNIFEIVGTSNFKKTDNLILTLPALYAIHTYDYEGTLAAVKNLNIILFITQKDALFIEKRIAMTAIRELRKEFNIKDVGYLIRNKRMEYLPLEIKR